MTFQEYLDWMFTANNVASYVCIVITIFFALSVLGETFNGFRRTASRQIIHIIFTCAALLIAFFITKGTLTEMHNFFSGTTIEDILLSIEQASPELEISAEIRNALANADAHLVELILTMPYATIIAPFVFMILYFIINLIAKIVFWIISKIIPKASTLAGTFLGMALGLAEGVIVTAVILLPFAAFSDVFGGVADRLDTAIEMPAPEVSEDGEIAAGDEEMTFAEVYEEYIKPIGHNPILDITRSLGGDAIIEAFAVVDLGDGKIDMRDELCATIDVIISASAMGEVDWAQLTEENKAAITSIVESVQDSEYLSEIVSGVLVLMADITEALPEEDTEGAENESNELTDALMDDFLTIFKTSTKDNIALDLETFKNMYFILSDDGIILAFNEDSDTLLDALTAKDESNETSIDRIVSTIRKNPRTAPIITTLTKLSISVMASELGLGENVEAMYDDIKDGINDILAINYEDYANDDEYTAAIADSLNSTLKEQGIELDTEVVTQMADYVGTEFKYHEEFTEDDINDILLSYYDAVINSIPAE